VIPQALRESPILFVLAFAPLTLMLLGLARVRFSRMISQLKLLDAASGIPTETRPLG